MTVWFDWCAANDIAPVPAAPITVARFIAENAEQGIETLWPIVQEISRAHDEIGLADPTLSEIVNVQLSSISGIEIPRWGRKDKRLFHRLPYEVQLVLAEREKQRHLLACRAATEYGLLCLKCKRAVQELRAKNVPDEDEDQAA